MLPPAFSTNTPEQMVELLVKTAAAAREKRAAPDFAGMAEQLKQYGQKGLEAAKGYGQQGLSKLHEGLTSSNLRTRGMYGAGLGAAIGGVGGGLMGATSERKKNPLTTALSGALAGAAVGGGLNAGLPAIQRGFAPTADAAAMTAEAKQEYLKADPLQQLTAKITGNPGAEGDPYSALAGRTANKVLGAVGGEAGSPAAMGIGAGALGGAAYHVGYKVPAQRGQAFRAGFEALPAGGLPGVSSAAMDEVRRLGSETATQGHWRSGWNVPGALKDPAARAATARTINRGAASLAESGVDMSTRMRPMRSGFRSVNRGGLVGLATPWILDVLRNTRNPQAPQ